VEPATKDEFAQSLGTTLPGFEAWSLHNLAWIRVDLGQHDAAVTMLRAAVELDQKTWQIPANLSGILSRLDRCDEARAALDEARRRLAVDSTATAEDKLPLDELVRELEDCFERSQGRPPLPHPDAVAVDL